MTPEPMVQFLQHHLRGSTPLRLYFANYTRYTVVGRTYLLQQIEAGLVDVSLGVELHLQGKELNQARKVMRKAGMNSWVCQARPGKGEHGCSGGEWVLARTNLQTQSHFKCDTASNWASSIIRLKGVDVLVVALYLVHGRDPNSEQNKAILESLGSLISILKLPFLIAGDWNCTPAQMLECNFTKFLGGTIVVPSNVDYTCSSGEGAMIDFVICSSCLMNAVEVTADVNGPWKPHFGLHIVLHREGIKEEIRALQTPLPIPVVSGPRRQSWGSFVQKAEAEHIAGNDLRGKEPVGKGKTAWLCTPITAPKQKTRLSPKGVFSETWQKRPLGRGTFWQKNWSFIH